MALSTALSGMVGLPAAPRADAEGNVPGRTKPVPGGAPPAWSTPRMSDGARVSAGTPQVSWPSAATGSVSMAKPAVDARDRAVATPDSRTRVYAPGTPVWAETGVKSTAQGSVDVRVIDHAQALKAGVDGLIVTAKPGADLHDEVTIGVDYSAFEAAYGGGFGARLRLYALPECALTTPDVPACRVRTEIPNRNDAGTKSVTTTVGAKPVAMAPDATVPSAAPGMAVFALAASSDPASGAGNYSATSLSPEGSWSGGTQSGSFTYSYPVPLPPAASSLAPKIGLSYDSGSVDGTTAATQSQSSWVGDGWNTPSSFVERTYVPCSDSPGGSPSPVSTKDQCYAGEILTLSLNGSSAVLVWDAAQGVYKSTSEPGTVVTRVTGSNNGSGTYNTEYWKVTDRSGTVYMFGRNQLPGWSSGKPLTNSVDSVPVFSSHAGDPCYNAAGFAQSSCTMGYRWNLDYVVDLHQNAMAYYYKQDTNFYGKNNGAANVSYVRASYLDHIDYGFTDTNAYTAPAPNQVAFVTGERCVSGTCSPLNDSTKANWSDVPYDLNCNSGATCSAKGPSFWSTVRLKEISTKQYASTQYNTVDTIELQHTMPATGDAGPATLFLAGITRTGKDTTGGGSTSPIALPQVQFAGQAYPNRVDDPNDGLVPLYRYRISQIKTSTGATFGVSYTPTSDCVWPVSITPSTNTSRCFPVKWTPPGYSTPQNDWFHKYAVATVTQSDNSGAGASENQRTSYTYTGAAWHYDDNEVVKAQDRTWGQWRGYAKVQVRTGQAGQPQTLAETSYYQGMDGDTLPSGTRSVVLTDSQGGTHTDTAQLAGSPLESTSYLGDGGPIESSTISSYWVSDAKAIRNRTGLPALTSRYTGVVETWSRQAITSGATPTWRVTQTDQSYDTTTGLATFTNAHGDVAKTDQSTCTTVTYAPANTALNLVGLVAESETVAKSCGGQWPNGTSAPTAAQTNALAAPGSVSRPADVVADTRTYYDDATLARTWPQPAAPAWPQAAPTKGDVSITRSATNYTGGAYTYQTTSATVADSYGRPIEVYDARGNKTTTAYTTTAGLVTGNTVTNALGQTASVTIRPARGLTVGATDINNVATTSQYDSLGRLTSVWGANRATSSPANATFTYSLSQTQPSVVTTAVLNNSLGFDTTYKIYDSLLRERQTQSPTPQGGRMLTNTFYDSHGWVIKQNAPHWDDSTTPNGTLFIKPDNVIPNQQRLTLDGLGRTVIAISQRAGTDVEKTTTVYGGDRVTTVPPAGGIISATVVDALERNTEIDQYSAAPTVGVPADTFAGRFTLTGGTSQATKFTYNRLGRLATKIDAANNTWTTGYNMLGQATSQAHPDSGTSMTAYDAAGNMSSTTDARNVTVSYGYDVLNRKTAQYDGPNSSSPLLASWEYDGGAQTLPYAKGKLTSVSSYVDGSTYTRKVTTGFNVFGSALDNTVVIPSAEGNLAGTYTVTNKYSADLGLPTKKIYTAHGGLPTEIVNFGYTTMDMPATIGGNLAGYVAGVTYDAYKRPILEDLTPTGATGDLSFVYDDHTGALKTATYANGAGALHSVGLSYDLAGNVTRESTSRNNTTTETQCYGYDTLARLTQAWTATDNCAADPSGNNGATVGDPIGAASAYWTTWQIDPVGNRTKQTRHGLGTGDTTTDYNYPPAGPSAVRPHALTSTATTAPGGNTTTSYDYDNAGNTTARNLPTGSQVLKWDHRGKLATVKTPTGTSISSYIYDAEGGRLIRRDPGRTTLYLSGEELVLDTTSNTVTGSRFYPLVTGGQAIRTGTTTTAYKFEITDHHNTGTLSLDNTAQIPTWRQSSPYGEPRGTQPGSWPTQHGFLNAPANTNTGLVEIGAREYDPTIGRFTAVDPVVDTTKPQSLTGYGYVENSPVVKSDPSGLTSVDDRKGTCRERATDCKAAAPPTNPWGSSLVQKTAARVGIPSKSRWRPAGNVGVGSLFWSWLYSDRGRQPVDVVVANENDDITKLFMQSDSFSNVRRTVYGQLALGIDSGWGHNSIVSNPVANALRGTSDGVNVLGEGLFDPRNPAGVEAYLGSYDVNFQVESKTRDTVTVDVVISNRSSIGSATRDPVGGGSDSKIVKGFLNGGIAKVTGLRPGTGGVPKIDKQQDQWQLMEFRMSISCATTVTIGTDVIRSVCPAGGVN